MPRSGGIYDLPYFGKRAQKVGRVIDMWSQPCSADPYMMVLAGWHATPTIIWGLFKPDLIGYNWGEGGRAHGRKKKWKWSVPDAFYERDMGKLLPRWARFAGAFAERVGWYFCVADVTIDGAVLWTSLAMQYSGCPIEGGNYASGRGTEPMFCTPETWEAPYYGFLEHHGEGCMVTSSEVIVAPGYTASVAAGADIGNPEGVLAVYKATGFDMKIVEFPSGKTVAEASIEANGKGQGAANAVYRGTNHSLGYRSYKAFYKVHGNKIAGELYNFHLSASADKEDVGLLPDP